MHLQHLVWVLFSEDVIQQLFQSYASVTKYHVSCRFVCFYIHTTTFHSYKWLSSSYGADIGRSCQNVSVGSEELYSGVKQCTRSYSNEGYWLSTSITLSHIRPHIHVYFLNIGSNAVAVSHHTEFFSVRFEAFTAVTMKNVVFWDVALYRSLVSISPLPTEVTVSKCHEKSF
jgi:hypothetical protein